MRKALLFGLMFLLLFSVGATAETEAAYTETIVEIANGDHAIPATIVMPTKAENAIPAVVMLHGTGSSRDEAGNGYAIAAPVLAEKYGIATIRIDFMGNGDSKAEYTGYTFESAVSDAVAAADYMAKLDGIGKIGVMGWSQGGTDALLATGRSDRFTSIVTWAGAPDMMLDGFFAQSDYEEAKQNGFFVMEFDWRENLKVSLQWCEDVANTDVLEVFSTFEGPVLAIAGTMDTTVDPEWSNKIVAASKNPQSKVYLIDGMDHTFNVFTGDLTALNDAVDATGAFFAETLK